LSEKWSGKTLTIRGSFVAIWNSLVAQGSWNDSSYSPPIRDWDYDTDYQSGALPPMTPSAVEIVKGAWWQG